MTRSKKSQRAIFLASQQTSANQLGQEHFFLPAPVRLLKQSTQPQTHTHFVLFIHIFFRYIITTKGGRKVCVHTEKCWGKIGENPLPSKRIWSRNRSAFGGISLTSSQVCVCVCLCALLFVCVRQTNKTFARRQSLFSFSIRSLGLENGISIGN